MRKETKTGTGKEITRITKSKLNTPIDIKDQEYILSLCKRSNRYTEKASREGKTTVIPRMVPIAGGRRVRMLCLEGPSEDPSRKGAHTRVPISKSKLLEDLFPKKTKKKASASHMQNVRSAMRLAIHPQIVEFRESVSYPAICAETGREILPYDKTHIDHSEIPFVKLCEDWLTSVDKYYSDIQLCGPPTAKRFTDSVLENSWQNYHSKYASLDIVLAHANISKGAGDLWNGTDRESREESKINLNF